MLYVASKGLWFHLGTPPTPIIIIKRCIVPPPTPEIIIIIIKRCTIPPPTPIIIVMIIQKSYETPNQILIPVMPRNSVWQNIITVRARLEPVRDCFPLSTYPARGCTTVNQFSMQCASSLLLIVHAHFINFHQKYDFAPPKQPLTWGNSVHDQNHTLKVCFLCSA